jgi:hypothetical protein
MDVNDFVTQIAEASNDDFPQAFKLLGFVVFLTQEGHEEIIARNMISQRTYIRWMDVIQKAGWGDLVADARLRQVVQEYLWKRFEGLPIDLAREKLLNVISDMVCNPSAPALKAKSRQASDAVKGERSEAEGREGMSSALDGGADGGSLEKLTAPIIEEENPRSVIRGCNVQEKSE